MPSHKKSKKRLLHTSISLLGKIIIAGILWTGIWFLSMENNKQDPNNKKGISPRQEIEVNLDTKDRKEDTTSHILELKNIQFDEKKIVISDKFSSQEKTQIKKIIQNIITNIDKNLLSDISLLDSIEQIRIHGNQKDSRGYAGNNSIILFYDPEKKFEFEQVLIHELGHIIDRTVLEGSGEKSEDKSEFFTFFGQKIINKNDPSLEFYTISWVNDTQRRTEQEEGFCSIYGMTNPSEDFAECLNLYLYHNKYFTLLTQHNSILEKKYNFFAKLFVNTYIEEREFLEKKIYHRHYDSTKIGTAED